MNQTAHALQPESGGYPEPVIEAAGRIAPAWPLDTAIAVNPWWTMRQHKFSDVAAKLEVLGDVECLMPGPYFREQWQQSIERDALKQAADELGYPHEVDGLVSYLDEGEGSLPHWHNFSELLDAMPGHSRKMAWGVEVVQQISQFCGLYFQHPRHTHPDADRDAALYQSWLEVARRDKGIEVLMGEHGLHQQFLALPEQPEELCDLVQNALGSPDNFAEYAHALLLDVSGWASWLAYTAWKDVFSARVNTHVEQLLAIRLAWEWVLWRHFESRRSEKFVLLRERFLKQFERLPEYEAQHKNQQRGLWVWQRAAELGYQAKLAQALLSESVTSRTQNPQLQAAFCIDVRSEPLRRALEAQHDDIETLGFAGFFGLPLEYSPEEDGYRRPQLPGLLTPAIRAVQKGPRERGKSLGIHVAQRKESAFDAAPASFGLVEMLGIFKAGKLLKNSLMPSVPEHPINDLCDDRPFELIQNGQALTTDEKAALAASVLQNMGLTQRFAPIVLLLGHGSCTANNPQAAALDCGACGGQTGEVNVKVLAQLLNNTDIRQRLRASAIEIPEPTRFVAGLHNTTTDDIICYGEDVGEPWQGWLENATRLAQKNRAKSVDIKEDADLSAKYLDKSQNWSEIRPEWGLANNAAFIVAPREVTRNIDLGGRSFLHDYHWQQDKDFATLELIMTAPMVVTNWINLQYYGSTVDNRKYGSGNKLLHNVVGSHIGVFEGNGGDLRIGLSKQSLHDGRHWRHQPLRLSVYLAAPREAIADIVDRHEAVAQLINNDWLYVFQLDTENREIARYYQSDWKIVASDGESTA